MKYVYRILPLLILILLLAPKIALATPTQYQQCSIGSTCTIGEFVYDDEYLPVATATCNLTTRDPDGVVILNSVAMTGTADGWYSYGVGTTSLVPGIYRSQVCCTVSTDYMCLDKTFQVYTDNTSVSAIANAVWTNPSRSLTSFGSLVSDIWSNATRTLSSGNLDNGSTLATSTGLAGIGSSLNTLTFQVSQVQSTLATVDTKVTSLQSQVSNIQTDTTNILLKWGSYSLTDVLNYVDTLETQLGNNTNTCADNTVYGRTQCLIDKWGAQTATGIYTAANSASSTITLLRSELNYNGKSTTAYDDIITLKNYVDSLETSLGTSSDTSATATVFGRVKQVQEAVDDIDASSVDLSELMDKWGSYSATDIYDKVKNLSSEVSAINTVTNVTSILDFQKTQNTDLTSLKNQAAAIKALLDVNRIQLEQLGNQPIIKTWLEEGSIIFKTLITNPSSIATQKVPFTYYYPPEFKPELVIRKSSGLEIKFDATKNAYYSTGDFDLKPRDTLILEVEVKDVWQVPPEQIESLKKQADELFKPLSGTSYYAQGSTLHSDIIASLDKISLKQNTTALPEERIQNFRESSVELESINKKMDDLKNILSSAGSIGTLSGFIGGVQAVGVWGIIVIIIAGFVFMTLYFRSLTKKSRPSQVSKKSTSPFVKPISQESSSQPVHPKTSHHLPRHTGLVAAFIFSVGLTTAGTAYYMSSTRPAPSSPTPVDKPMVLSATDEKKLVPTQVPEIILEATPTLEPTLEPEPTMDTRPTNTPVLTSTPKPILPPPVQANSQPATKIVTTPSLKSYVNLRSLPDRTSTLVKQISSGEVMQKIGEQTNNQGELWYQVQTDLASGWVLAELTQAISPSTPTNTSSGVTIRVPAYDTVNLYQYPSVNSKIVSKITETQKAELLVQTKRWAKVLLKKGLSEGWLSQDFIDLSLN